MVVVVIAVLVIAVVIAVLVVVVVNCSRVVHNVMHTTACTTCY